MEAAPLYEEVARAPAGGEAWWLPTSDGAVIRTATWPRANGTPERGTVLIFPGRTEYIEKYGHVATQYAERGYATLTVDWRGQGLTARTCSDTYLGHVTNFDEYQHDIAAAMNLAQWLELPEPYFLVAHSMGGCIGLRALHEGLPVKAVAFSSPMWGVQMQAWERPMAWVSGLVGPLVGLGNMLTPRTDYHHPVILDVFENNELTSDPEMWAVMKDQMDRYPALALGGPTVTWLRAALLETRRLARKPAPDLPAVAFLGGHERIVEPRSIRRVMAKWPNGRLEFVPGAEHEIMMEKPETRQRFIDTSDALFRAHA